MHKRMPSENETRGRAPIAVREYKNTRRVSNKYVQNVCFNVGASSVHTLDDCPGQLKPDNTRSALIQTRLRRLVSGGRVYCIDIGKGSL